MKPNIYTIGHSTRSMEEFVAMLRSFNIQLLVDIRSMPGSRKFPHFNQENLEIILPQAGIEYLYMEGLGGRRKVKKDSKNTRWNNLSFRAYADYMETEDFKTAVNELQDLARAKTTAYMCSEAVWWRCHRSMVSDYLKVKGWAVHHIMDVDKSQDHRYTAPAIIKANEVVYSEEA